MSAAPSAVPQTISFTDAYRIALDDFTRDDPRQSLLHLADFLKFDIRRKGWQEIVTLFRTEHWESTDLIAEQVESREEFDLARRAGFQFFQGNFVRRITIDFVGAEKNKDRFRAMLARRL